MSNCGLRGCARGRAARPALDSRSARMRRPRAESVAQSSVCPDARSRVDSCSCAGRRGLPRERLRPAAPGDPADTAAFFLRRYFGHRFRERLGRHRRHGTLPGVSYEPTCVQPKRTARKAGAGPRERCAVPLTLDRACRASGPKSTPLTAHACRAARRAWVRARCSSKRVACADSPATNSDNSSRACSPCASRPSISKTAQCRSNGCTISS